MNTVLVKHTILDRLAHTISSISQEMSFHGRDLSKINSLN